MKILTTRNMRTLGAITLTLTLNSALVTTAFAQCGSSPAIQSKSGGGAFGKSGYTRCDAGDPPVQVYKHVHTVRTHTISWVNNTSQTTTSDNTVEDVADAYNLPTSPPCTLWNAPSTTSSSTDKLTFNGCTATSVDNGPYSDPDCANSAENDFDQFLKATDYYHQFYVCGCVVTSGPCDATTTDFNPGGGWDDVDTITTTWDTPYDDSELRGYVRNQAGANMASDYSDGTQTAFFAYCDNHYRAAGAILQYRVGVRSTVKRWVYHLVWYEVYRYSNGSVQAVPKQAEITGTGDPKNPVWEDQGLIDLPQDGMSITPTAPRIDWIKAPKHGDTPGNGGPTGNS
jgi:hypothetical protein